MGLLDALTGALNPVKGLADTAGAIIGKFKLDPAAEKQAEQAILQLEIAALQAERDFKLEYERLITSDLASLRDQIKTELLSEDPYVRRARPTWLYALLLVYIVNYAVIPVLAAFLTVNPYPIPEEVHFLAGSIMLGYSYFRTREKTATSSDSGGTSALTAIVNTLRRRR